MISFMLSLSRSLGGTILFVEACGARATRGRTLLRWQPQALEVGTHDHGASESTFFRCLPVVGLRKRSARNLEWVLLLRPERRNQMGEHQVSCSSTLCHGGKIGH